MDLSLKFAQIFEEKFSFTNFHDLGKYPIKANIISIILLSHII